MSVRCEKCGSRSGLDRDDFGLNQSKIMNVIDSNNLERDMQISLRNLRKLDCAGKPVPTFPDPALDPSRLVHFAFRSGNCNIFRSDA
jgi:hypothetical protein